MLLFSSSVFKTTVTSLASESRLLGSRNCELLLPPPSTHEELTTSLSRPVDSQAIPDLRLQRYQTLSSTTLPLVTVLTSLFPLTLSLPLYAVPPRITVAWLLPQLFKIQCLNFYGSALHDLPIPHLNRHCSFTRYRVSFIRRNLRLVDHSKTLACVGAVLRGYASEARTDYIVQKYHCTWSSPGAHSDSSSSSAYARCPNTLYAPAAAPIRAGMVRPELLFNAATGNIAAWVRDGPHLDANHAALDTRRASCELFTDQRTCIRLGARTFPLAALNRDNCHGPRYSFGRRLFPPQYPSRIKYYQFISLLNP